MMNKNLKSIKKKASFFRMYGKKILVFILCVGLLYVLTDTNPSHSIFYKEVALLSVFLIIGIGVIVLIGLLIYLVFEFFISCYRQTKLPLKKEEMEILNITTPDEYLEFINKYLKDLTNFIIGEQIRNKIIITSYLYLYDKDTNDKKEKVLHNAFSFNKEDKCNNNYDFVYDFNNKITVNNENEFNQLVAKLFKKDLYDTTF